MEPATKRELVLPTGGGCMRPWIWPGGELHVERCSASALRVGDIAVWFDGHQLLSHRVLATDGVRFVTKGDSGTVPDEPAEGMQLVGRAVRFRKGPVSYRLDGMLPRVGERCLAPVRRLRRMVGAALRRARA